MEKKVVDKEVLTLSGKLITGSPPALGMTGVKLEKLERCEKETTPAFGHPSLAGGELACGAILCGPPLQEGSLFIR